MNLSLWMLFCGCLIISVAGDSVEDAVKENQIVPDVIDKAPQKTIEVKYLSGVSASLGNELTPTQVKDIPTVMYDADDTAFYTLILTDPDAPSRQNPMYREWRHWTVVNIPGNNIADGDTLFEYIGSGPPKDTGLHRYVFLLYKQAGKIAVDEKRIGKEGIPRMRTKAKDFAGKYNLGDPVAINFYQAQYDDYVPILHAQLG